MSAFEKPEYPVGTVYINPDRICTARKMSGERMRISFEGGYDLEIIGKLNKVENMLARLNFRIFTPEDLDILENNE